MVLAGLCPREAARFFLFGGRLLALKKKTGGIRLIAVGFTLRRLASKCASTCGPSRLSSYFSPRQLGVGVLADAKRPFILPDVIWRRYHLPVSL